VKLFNGGVGDFVNRAVQVKIQDGGRKRNCMHLSLTFLAATGKILRPILT
jgi:hypothetical protein